MPDNWRVSSQFQTTSVTPDGRVMQVVRVHYVTANGFQGSVDVPLDVYSPETVTALIDRRTEATDAVAQL